jgi:predicted dehydrogenase
MAGDNSAFGRELRMGMVGGGPGAFIGEVHRKAARMDGGIRLVAGAFSSDPEKSRQTGREQLLDPRRVYGGVSEMIRGELSLPPGERIDFVSIVTPNHLHFPVSRDFLRAGFHVVCDKPMTLDVREALALREIVRKSKKVFALTHNYTGFPMVKLARDMIRQGDLGRVLKIVVQYPQGWLVQPLERRGSKQAEWRTDPKRSGVAGCMGDLGTHAENLAEYVTGLRIREICADLTTFVPGRRIPDDGNCLVRFERGAKGILIASQVSIGEENDLAIWVYGQKRSLEWFQENPNELYVRGIEQPVQVWRRGNGYIGAKSPAAARAMRVPFGHPEGYLEAFANIYVNVAATIRAALDGVKPDPMALDFPTVDDGVRGMQFLEAVVQSSRLGAKWVKLPKG